MGQRSRSEQRAVRRWSPGGERSAESVELATEEPLAIELDGIRVATTMRTPGDDFELAVGFCHNEGLLAGHRVLDVSYCRDGDDAVNAFNIVQVVTGGKAPTPAPRLSMTTSSCGFCGTDDIDELAARLAPVEGDPLDWSLLAGAPDALRTHQTLFDATGAVHAAGILEPSGEVSLVREDVGRHNAVDKLVGRRVLDGDVPLAGRGVVVSGRASFELVHKAWAAGFRALVAVSAPTALAVATAGRAGLQLAGFARDGSLTVYID